MVTDCVEEVVKVELIVKVGEGVGGGVMVTVCVELIVWLALSLMVAVILEEPVGVGGGVMVLVCVELPEGDIDEESE